MASDPWAVVGIEGADPWAVVPDEVPLRNTDTRLRWLREFGPGSLAQFNQGLSLGGADEIVAGAEALGGGDYRGSLERQKAERQAFQAEHPLLAGSMVAAGAVTPVILSTLAGTAAGGPPGGVAAATGTGARAAQLTRQALGLEGAQAVGRANTVTQAAKEGARAAFTPGAVAGFLSADPGQRDVGAAQGAAMGTVLGAGLGGGIQLAQNWGGRATLYPQRVAQYLGVNPSNRAYAQPPRGGGNVTPITRDEAMILQRMEEGGVTPEVAALELTRARKAGVPLALVDVGGQPVQRMARGVRSLPGKGSAVIDEALTTRAQEAPERVVGAVEQGVGRKATGNSGAASDALLRQARTDSSPLYRKLETLPAIEDKEVASVFQIPAVRDIVKRAEANAAKFGRPVNPLFDDEGNLLRNPTFLDVDMVKQSLDDLLSPTYNMGPRPADAPALSTRMEQKLARDLRQRLLRLADKAPGGATYRSARESYAAPARARDQYNEGLDFTRKNTSLEDVRAQRREGSPADRKWYDRGAVEGIRQQVMSASDLTGQPNALRQFFGNPEARSKVNALVSPRRAEMFNERMAMENRAAQTNNFVRSGSQTADKAAEAVDVAAELASTTPQGPRAVATAAAQKVWDRVRMSANEATRERIARHLVNMDPAQQLAFLNRLSQLQQKGQINADQVATVASVVTRQKQSK